MKASNKAVTEETRKQIAQLQSSGWYHSIELPNGEVIAGLQSLEQLRNRVSQFDIPQDLTGKRVLDIGAWDGWFSFEMERRGASVVAVDGTRSEKFLLARELLNSKVEYHISDVYDLSPKELGQFDIVLFLGVLYHLKHPLLGLERACAMSTDVVCVESYVSDDGLSPNAAPSMEFYETTELCGQFDNWVGPNTACLLSLCRASGFAQVSLESVLDQRAHVTCLRKWRHPAGNGASPYIVCVENSVTRNHVISANKDDYVSIWFKAGDSDLNESDVFPEIGPYGVRPVFVRCSGGDGWHAIVKLPVGLPRGWTDVRMRVRDSDYSNTVVIGVSVTEDERRERTLATGGDDPLTIEIVADGKTWERNQVRKVVDACISLWVRGLPGNCELRDVSIRINGCDLASVFISEPDPAGLRQVNALLPSGLEPGSVEVNVCTSDATSPPVRVDIVSC